eukprot:364967-Chlamydomonas_euryale.AAC.3
MTGRPPKPYASSIRARTTLTTSNCTRRFVTLVRLAATQPAALPTHTHTLQTTPLPLTTASNSERTFASSFSFALPLHSTLTEPPQPPPTASNSDRTSASSFSSALPLQHAVADPPPPPTALNSECTCTSSFSSALPLQRTLTEPRNHHPRPRTATAQAPDPSRLPCSSNMQSQTPTTTHRLEQRPHKRLVLLVCLAAKAHGRSDLANEARRVGHHAHDARLRTRRLKHPESTGVHSNRKRLSPAAQSTSTPTCALRLCMRKGGQHRSPDARKQPCQSASNTEHKSGQSPQAVAVRIETAAVHASAPSPGGVVPGCRARRSTWGSSKKADTCAGLVRMRCESMRFFWGRRWKAEERPPRAVWMKGRREGERVEGGRWLGCL